MIQSKTEYQFGMALFWIPTSGKTSYLMFRFYGPEEDFHNKTLKLAGAELAK
jgi:hypothetical protein